MKWKTGILSRETETTHTEKSNGNFRIKKRNNWNKKLPGLNCRMEMTEKKKISESEDKSLEST